MTFLSLRRLLLALVLVGTATGCDSGGGSGDGTATGTVTNSFSRPVQGATVTLASGTTTACTATTDASGTFSCDVAAGTYTVTVTVAGYSTQTFTATVNDGGTTTLTVPQLVGLGSINATLVNAVTGTAIGDATVECRRQLADGSYGDVEFTGTATALGQLIVAGAFTGEAQCTATAGGVAIPLQITIRTNTTGTIAATPAPASGSYRVVLTWGENPSDLDSHLTGPTGTGSDRFHVYYSNESALGHSLDVDDVSSFGPETITIVPDGVNGMYRYSVHNYLEDGADGVSNPTDGIAASGATVRLYDATGLLRTYTPPAPTAANGGTDADTWRVFEITVNGATASIAGTAPAGLGYFQADDPGDVTVFLTGGPAPGPPPRPPPRSRSSRATILSAGRLWWTAGGPRAALSHEGAARCVSGRADEPTARHAGWSASTPLPDPMSHDDDAPRERAPEQNQDLPGADETTSETVATPETDGARVAEAGHGYVGRTMDDSLKTTPRLRDGDAAVDDTPAEAGDEDDT